MAGPVLIIEDDPDIAEILRYSLEKESFRTRIALTGEEGLYASLDRSDIPSIILLDLQLPGMHGTEICRRLRQEPTTRTTPILIITARALESDLLTAFQLGADDYIVKPFELREVIARVRSLLHRVLRQSGDLYCKPI
jgi:two-component system phosphate regulon response regulator PhoB